jgi:hypothetical protein
MTLLHLAPAIQQYLLLLAVSQASPISEVGLRRIAREPDGIASVPFLTPYWCGSNAFGIPPPSVSALVCQLTLGLATETVAFS